MPLTDKLIYSESATPGLINYPGDSRVIANKGYYIHHLKDRYLYYYDKLIVRFNDVTETFIESPTVEGSGRKLLDVNGLYKLYVFLLESDSFESNETFLDYTQGMITNRYNCVAKVYDYNRFYTINMKKCIYNNTDTIGNRKSSLVFIPVGGYDITITSLNVDYLVKGL